MRLWEGTAASVKLLRLLSTLWLAGMLWFHSFWKKEIDRRKETFFYFPRIRQFIYFSPTFICSWLYLTLLQFSCMDTLVLLSNTLCCWCSFYFFFIPLKGWTVWIHGVFRGECFCVKARVANVLILNTLILKFFFSTLFSLLFIWYWQEEYVWQSQHLTSLVLWWFSVFS